MYSGAVIYDQVAQFTFQFYYLEVKFKLQNYFTALTYELGTKVRLRLSIYDPRFIMPSINTQIQNMNIPPQFCQLQFKEENNFVEFLDEMTLTIIGCYDENQPLLYSIQMYPNSSIYESDLIQSNFYHYLLIKPPQEQNTFQFTLPYLNRAESLLVVLIQDSIGGITNITKSINVKKFENFNEDTLKQYQQKLISLNQQLIGYRILSERLSQINTLQSYKQNLFEQLIILDQNQTFHSNQTESLYHSISILAGQNCSILQINQTQFLIQLNYRISLATQELYNLNQLQLDNLMTSQQNIKKLNFIKQSQTFANILSSFIKFRVQFNNSAIDIQDQLTNIINKLQDISIANEPMYKVDTDTTNLHFGYLTSKLAQEVTGTSFLYTNELDNSDLDSTTNFYKYSQTRYIDNPFYSSEGFPKNSSGYQAVDPKMQNKNTTTDEVTLQSPMKFSFPDVEKLAANTSLKCIAQVNSTQWSAGVCKTVKNKENVICQCNTLNPTSLMESLDLILDKAQQIYSLDTLLAFASFPFYQTIVFYFYLTITGSYLTIIYWGTKVDNIMFLKNQVEVEQISDNNGIPSKPLENQNESQDEHNNNQEEIILSKTIFKNHTTRILNIINKQKILDQEDLAPQIISLRDLQQNDHNLQQQFTATPKIIYDDYPLIKLQSPREQQFKDNLQQDQIKQVIQQQEKITKLKAYLEYLKFFHQILSVIYKYDEKQPRALRATIVYTSIMGSLAVLFVFNQPNNLSLTVALALITAPLNKIYQIVLEKLLTNKKKVIRSIGGVLMISVAGFISYTMLAGLILSGSVETANKWSYIFIGTFSLDNLIYSPIQLILQYCVHIGLINFPTLQKLLHKFLDDKGKEFLKEIFIKTGLV